MTPEEYRAAGHQLVDWIADFRSRIETLPVKSPALPGDVSDRFPSVPPAGQASLEELVADLDQILLPACSHPQHPGFMAFFPANASLSSALGDLVSTGLGQLGITWELSPALTELEQVVCDWMRQLYGLSDRWRGTIQDTASSGALVAMLCARERALGEAGRVGLQAAAAPLVVYASSQAHSSVAKAVHLAGFGAEHLRLVEVDASLAMRVEALEAAITADIAAGLRPAAVIATVGTTATTALDPVAAIAEISARNGIWCHLDAAMAGSAMLLPDLRWMWDGVEAVDSISINPHKWMGTAFDCSLFYVRDPAELVGVMSTSPSYLRTTVDGAVTQYRDWGIPLGRRFRALKLWFQLRLDGIESIQHRIRRDLEYAQRLLSLASAHPDWRVVAPVPLQTVCLRHEPEGLTPEETDRHTLAWVERVNRAGNFYLTPALVEGRWLVRVSFGAETTEPHHVDRLWQELQQAVAG